MNLSILEKRRFGLPPVASGYLFVPTDTHGEKREMRILAVFICFISKVLNGNGHFSSQREIEMISS